MSDTQHPNYRLLQQFYFAFVKKNVKAMVACYHPEVTFNDPVFENLNYTQVSAMWEMLIERSDNNLEVTFSNIDATENKGGALWEARYLFGKHKKHIHNKVQASFEFKERQIIRHTDDFDFWKWSSMALGGTGFFLGFTPMVKNKVKKYANAMLETYILEQKNKRI